MMNNRLKSIAFICFEQFQILDLAGPMQVFDSSKLSGKKHYQIKVLSKQGGLVYSSCGLAVATEPLTHLEGFDSLIVVGGKGTQKACQDQELINFVREQSGRVKRTISICTGTFILSQAGLLNGKRATTHWNYIDRLKDSNPSILIESDSLYVYDKNMITSAGVTAGMDLALALVEQDIDRETAMRIARNLVIYFHRSGGQQQFSEPLKSQSLEHSTFRQLCLEIISEPQNKYGVDGLAEQMNMSPRNFSRRFIQEVGISPGKYVEKIRVDHAKRLLAESNDSIESVANQCGLSSEVLRRTFIRYLGVSPTQYRDHFGISSLDSSKGKTN